MNSINKSAICISGLFLFIIHTMYGQGKEIPVDSSYSYLKKQIRKFQESYPARAILYANAYLQKANRHEDTDTLIYRRLKAYKYKSEVLKKDTLYLNFLNAVIDSTRLNPTENYPRLAYRGKGLYYLEKEQHGLALKSFLLALEEAKKFNKAGSEVFLQNLIKGIYDRKKADQKANLEKKLKQYRQYQNDTTLKRDSRYFLLLMAIAGDYMNLEKFDSAGHYNRMAYNNAVRLKPSQLLPVMMQGKVEYLKGNYTVAIDSMKKALSINTVDQAYLTIYIYLARSYYKLDSIPQFLRYSLKMDSVSVEKKITVESQAAHYSLLVAYYKEKKDMENQLKYLNRYIYIDSIYAARKNLMVNARNEHISIPEALEERQRVIRELEATLFYEKVIKYGLYGITGCAFFFIAYQYRKRKYMKKRFEQIIKSYEKSGKKKPIVSKKQKVLNIPKEVVERVLKGLEVFEANLDFINSEVSLQLLADRLDTNVNYLSRIVNHYMGFGFSAYVNELRIDFLFRQMKRRS